MKLPRFLATLHAAAFASGGVTFMNAKAVCARLTISEPTLRRYEKTLPGFPRPVWIGPRRKVYRLEDVESYARTGFQPSNG